MAKATYFKLFSTFARMGAFTFGGGYAMLPILQREIVEKNHWCSEEDLLDYFAVGQCTPGIIAINTATFIGYRTRGVLGGIVATLGMIFPSWILISAIYHVLTAFESNLYVKYALSGIQVAVAALITYAVVKLGKKSIVDKITAGIAVISLLLLLFLDISPIVFVLAGIAVGIGIKSIRSRNGKDGVA